MDVAASLWGTLWILAIMIVTWAIPIAVAIWFFRAFSRLNESVDGIRAELAGLNSALAGRTDLGQP